VLALAQKLHDQYVSEGQSTRERLISEGQVLHDEFVGELNANREELLSSAQATHDALIAEATAKHEQLISEAHERSTGMVAEAEQTRATVLDELGRERDLLQKTIDLLRTFERDYRARLKAYLETQLQELVQASPMAPDGEGGDQSQGQPQDGHQPKG
jgi:cell division septum initiation protein DivIVA